MSPQYSRRGVDASLLRRNLNILFTSAGRRVGLLNLFRLALRSLDVKGRIFAGDSDHTAPTMHRADSVVVLPPVTSPAYVDTLRNFCRAHDIGLVIPLIDPELHVLSPVKELFRRDGTLVMVSDDAAIDMAQDKLKTAALFSETGLPTPKTVAVRKSEQCPSVDELCDNLGLPLVFKPRFGSSGKGIFICSSPSSVARVLQELEGDYIAQQYVDGVEVTIDVFGDGHGSVFSLVPRKRLKVRAGEVERGVTVSDSLFRDDIMQLARTLKPFGAINVQCFVSKHGPMYTEINGRFGGGYPLAHAAGARFPELIIRLALGETPKPLVGQYEVGIVMSRYDEAVYFDARELPNADQLMSLPFIPTTGDV